MNNNQRLLSLDVMRGLTLALMILVNTPGSWSAVYAPLLHADWHGATPTDYVFPFFLFIVGSALFLSGRRPLSLRSRMSKILLRSSLIFLIGLLLNAYPFTSPLSELRVPGVLQRIALAYAIAAPIALFFTTPVRWIAMSALLLGYWALLQLGSDPYGVTGSVVRQVDLWLLGPDRLWQGMGVAFDPEGLVSTLPAVVSVLIGYEATRYLCSCENRRRALQVMAAVGVLLVLAGLLWHVVFPINKYLWTSSFVLLTGGAAMLLLVVLILLEPCTVLAPVCYACEILGKNPLFIYVLSILWAKTLYLIPVGDGSAYQWGYQVLAGGLSAKNASLVFALVNVAAMWLVAWMLHRRRIVISI